MKLDIRNEFDPLEAVLVHRPSDEIDRLTHDNMRPFLFEDIPFLRRMQREHDAFVEAMKGRGIAVYYVEDFIKDLLIDRDHAKPALIRQICEAERVGAVVDDLLDEKLFPDDALLRVLFAGITDKEFAQATGRRAPAPTGRHQFILPPIPNAYFSRDPAVVVGPSAIACKMHYLERVRETILTRAVLEFHPEFRESWIAFGGSSSPLEDRPYTIEGGDVLVLNQEAVLVGVSERTRSETIEMLAKKTFVVGHVKRLYEIPIPTERTFMHLDTVFTIVDRGLVVWYPGVMENIKYIHHYAAGADGKPVRKPEDRNLLAILNDEFGCETQVVRTGGGDEHYASREQRTDGTNVFAIAPRVACTYERNVRTIEAMEKAGIEVLAVEGSELVRGLGGPRCMTMPLRRHHS